MVLRSILCADWSKEARGREVYCADVGEARVRRETTDGGWSVEVVLRRAEELSGQGPVLVGFDAPLGVPASYMRAFARETCDNGSAGSFPRWLSRAVRQPRFFEGVRGVAEWSVRRPFLALPPGKGSRKRWEARVAAMRVEPLRWVDRVTGAKPVFIVSGIPGSVGSAARDLWQGLLPSIEKGRRTLHLWPFDGSLADLARRGGVVVGEIYPRVAYALTLRDGPPASRTPLPLGKNKERVRESAVELLHRAPWMRAYSVDFGDTRAPLASADAFDAWMNALGLLRCALEAYGLADPAHEDPVAEGGILGLGGVKVECAGSGTQRGRT